MVLPKDYLIKRKSISSISAILFYRILLDIIYIKVITPFFEYSGFKVEYDISLYLLSWIVLLLFIPIIVNYNNNLNRPSNIIMLILLIVAFVPYTTMMGYSFFTLYYIFFNTLYWFLLFLFHNIFLRIKFLSLKQSKKNINNIFIIIIGVIFLLVNVFISWRYTGFRFNINLFDVYNLRSEASSFALPIIIEYLFAASKAVNPLLLIFALNKKKYFAASLILLVQLLSFGISGMKSIFFVTIVVVLVYFFYKEKYITWIPWLSAWVCLIGLIEYSFLKSFNLIDLLIRRMMFLTNMLNAYYFDFFSNNTPDYFRQSILRHFGMQSPYPDIRYMIGEIYFNRPNMGANSGLISDGITNFGIIGIVIMPIILGLVLKLLDGCVKGLDKNYYLALCILIAYYFISSFLFTVLMTHGLVALCIVFYLIPRNQTRNLKHV